MKFIYPFVNYSLISYKLHIECDVCVCSCRVKKALDRQVGRCKLKCRCTYGWELSSTRRNFYVDFLKAMKTLPSCVVRADCLARHRRPLNTSVMYCLQFVLYVWRHVRNTTSTTKSSWLVTLSWQHSYLNKMTYKPSKLGQIDLVCWLWSEVISKSVHLFMYLKSTTEGPGGQLYWQRCTQIHMQDYKSLYV